MQLYKNIQTSYNQSHDCVGVVHQMDPYPIENMNRGVVGFKINVDKLEGKAKLSQN
ncbi:hypothetical protein RG959_16310 [Domibacillus sp. 8LH]